MKSYVSNPSSFGKTKAFYGKEALKKEAFKV